MVLLRCVDAREAGLILKEIHEGAFGSSMFCGVEGSGSNTSYFEAFYTHVV